MSGQNAYGAGLTQAPQNAYAYGADTLVTPGTSVPVGASGTSTQVGPVIWTGGVLSNAVVEVSVTAFTGGTSPSVDVQLQDSFDGVNWNKVASTGPQTATGTYVIRNDGRANAMCAQLRVALVPGGTAAPTAITLGTLNDTTGKGLRVYSIRS